MRKVSLTMGAVAVAIAAVVVAPSQATFRGANGLLVYQKQVGKGANNVQLFTIRPDGTGETQITHFADSSADGANWSADGNKIVFTRHWNPGGHNERFEIYTMKADGSRMKALPRAGKFTLGPNWTPDGRRIVFLEGTTNRIERASTTVRRTCTRSRLTEPTGFSSPTRPTRRSTTVSTRGRPTAQRSHSSRT